MQMYSAYISHSLTFYLGICRKRERVREKDVLCLDVRKGLLLKRRLESATGKIIKGLALVFRGHLVLKQNVSSVSSI